MGEHDKIATCCYCGTRTTLALGRGEAGRRELACASCGAPLSRLKPLRATPERRERAVARPRRAEPERPARKKARRRRKPRKSVLKRFFEEFIDEIEDLFD